MAKVIKMEAYWTPEEMERADEVREMYQRETQTNVEPFFTLKLFYQLAVGMFVTLVFFAIMAKVSALNFIAGWAIEDAGFSPIVAVLMELPNILVLAAFYIGILFVVMKAPEWLVKYQRKTRPHLRKCILRGYSLRKAWRKQLHWNLPAFIFLVIVRVLAGKGYRRLLKEVS